MTSGDLIAVLDARRQHLKQRLYWVHPKSVGPSGKHSGKIFNKGCQGGKHCEGGHEGITYERRGSLKESKITELKGLHLIEESREKGGASSI